MQIMDLGLRFWVAGLRVTVLSFELDSLARVLLKPFRQSKPEPKACTSGAVAQPLNGCVAVPASPGNSLIQTTLH